ncbi:MAG: AgmX/PglI C-terminal domain-containing protein [Kofleriaceae bacterium]
MAPRLTTTTLLLAVGVLAAAGCGGTSTPPPAEPAPTLRRPPPVDDAPPEDEDDGLELVSDRGKFDPDMAAAKVAPHAGALHACYTDHLERRRWLGGSVDLTWTVGADGTLVSVHLSKSDLGAWPIERCLLEVAHSVEFGRPQGHGKADVTFPVTFAGGSAAVAWDDDRAARAVGPRLAELASCSKAGGGDPANVTVTAYVGTRGKVQSVGFSAPAPLASAWADCAEAKVAAWTLTDPRGKVAKLSVVYHPVAIDADDEE